MIGKNFHKEFVSNRAYPYILNLALKEEYTFEYTAMGYSALIFHCLVTICL